MMRSNKEAEFQFLSGWKEIANYLRKGVRTVQRYERELRLPIHRPAGKSSSSVIAFKAELDSWVKGIPVQLDERAVALRSQTNRIGVQFLQVDSEVGLTFSGMALEAHNREKRERQSDAAWKAYGTIMRLRRNFDLNETEKTTLDANLERLRGDLARLGKLPH